MYIYSDIYKQFNCIGSDCKTTCCFGWKLSFDSDVVDYYNHLEGEFGEFICQNMYWSENNGLTLVKMFLEKTGGGFFPDSFPEAGDGIRGFHLPQGFMQLFHIGDCTSFNMADPAL